MKVNFVALAVTVVGLLVSGCTSVSDEEERRIVVAAVKTVRAQLRTPEKQPSTPLPQITLEDVQRAVESGMKTALAKLSTHTPSPTATMVPTRLSTHTPAPTVTTTPAATDTPRPLPTPIPPLTPTPRTSPTATPTPLIQSIRPSNLNELQDYMLELINEERGRLDLELVTLGESVPAQLHAEEMLEQGYLSHWNLLGLKAYMRNGLAGGQGYASENVSGPPYFVPTCELKYCINDPFELLKETMEGLMDSPGHRRNILNPDHRLINLGIAYNGRTIWVVQVFDGDYVRYFVPPSIDNGLLQFAGSMKKGLIASSFQVRYDPEPSDLTLGQLAVTSCYTSGKPVALLRKPLGRRSFYTTHSSVMAFGGCPDPFSADPNSPVPTRDDPYPQRLSSASTTETIVPWITVEEWNVEGRDFEIFADLETIIDQQGGGVYTVMIFAQDEDEKSEPFVVSTYPIFLTD